MMLEQNKIALVTGANRGIGFATAEALLSKGYTVILTSRNEADGLEALKKLGHFGHCHYHPLNIDDAQSVEAVRMFVSERFGRLDVLINNAAIHYDTWHDSTDADLDEVMQTLQTNLMGAWRMSQAFIPMMRQHRFGRIVNVSSGAGALNGMGGEAPGYSVSKAALNALTIQLANTVRDDGILVNSVCPGWVRTRMGGDGAPCTPEQGASGIVWAAMLDDPGMTAKFFRDKKSIAW